MAYRQTSNSKGCSKGCENQAAMKIYPPGSQVPDNINNGGHKNVLCHKCENICNSGLAAYPGSGQPIIACPIPERYHYLRCPLDQTAQQVLQLLNQVPLQFQLNPEGFDPVQFINTQLPLIFEYLRQQAIQTGFRITLIGANGEIIFDSATPDELPDIEFNSNTRREVLLAILQHYGWDTRISTYINTDTITDYLAVDIFTNLHIHYVLRFSLARTVNGQQNPVVA